MMKNKKTFFNLMAVAIVVAICVGVVSCSKGEKPEEVDYSKFIIGKWVHRAIGSQGMWESESMIEFKIDNTYLLENLTGRNEGNYLITESKKTDYLDITESYLIVDSTVVYFEYTDDTLKTWEIVNGAIKYIDGISWPIDLAGSGYERMYFDKISDNYCSGHLLKYTRDSTVIVADTTYYDACHFSILVSESSDFEQLDVLYIYAKNFSSRILLGFYSHYELVEQPKWYSRSLW